MSQQLYKQLSQVVLQTNLPNHSECLHKTFTEFLYCDYTSAYELKILVEFLIKKLQEGRFKEDESRTA